MRIGLGRQLGRVAREPQELRLKILLDIIALVAIVGGILSVFPEERWEAGRFAARNGRAFDSDLVLVGLDQAYATNFGEEVDVDAEYLSTVVRSLSDLGARVVAVDVLIGPRVEAQNVRLLVAAVQYAKSKGTTVVFPIRTGGYGADRKAGRRVSILARPPLAIDSLVRTGYSEFALVTPASGLDRLLGPPAALDLPLLIRTADGVLVPSFAMAAVSAFEGNDRESDVEDWLRAVGIESRNVLGEIQVPLDYRSPPVPPNVRYLASEEVVSATGRLGRLSDSLVLVAGLYDANGKDEARTPYGTVRGGVVHLHGIDTLLRQSWPRRWPPAAVALYALILAVACATSWWKSQPVGLATLMVAFILVFAVGIIGAEAGSPGPMAWPIRLALLGSLIGYLARPSRSESTA